MKVRDREKLNNPMKGLQIQKNILLMVFHTVHWLSQQVGQVRVPPVPKKEKLVGGVAVLIWFVPENS